MLEQETPNIASMASLPTLSAPGLLVMDVDSTLIDEEVIDELGVAAGVGEQIASVTARAMNGELDFREALRARVALLKGLPTTIFDEVYHRVHFTRMIGRSAWSPVVFTRLWTVSRPMRISIIGLRTVWRLPMAG